jgi:hypothetical protein
MQAVSSLVNMTQNARFPTYRFSPCGSSLVSISNAAARLCPSRGLAKKMSVDRPLAPVRRLDEQ